MKELDKNLITPCYSVCALLHVTLDIKEVSRNRLRSDSPCMKHGHIYTHR